MGSSFTQRMAISTSTPARVRVVTSNETLTTAYDIFKITTAEVTVILPTAVGIVGTRIQLDNASTGECYAQPYGSETVQDEVIQPFTGKMDLYSDGTNWRFD